MIVKSYEIKNYLKKTIFLFHGQNDGLKEELVNKNFKPFFESTIFNYFEKEILNNIDDFYNSILSRSFFDDKKLIIIKDASDKIRSIIENILEKKIENVKIILFSSTLEKKSKLRNFFEKNSQLVSVAFYKDNNQTLASIASSFFKNKNIPTSQETINMLINKLNGERKNLNNELEKIEMYAKSKKKISLNEINQLTNLSENNDINELVDNCLAKNSNKIIYIMNENNFTQDDAITILRIFLFKAKRLLYLVNNYSIEKNIEKTISSAKPPIFWKDKDLVSKQIKIWTKNEIEKFIIKTNEIELLIKKNSQNCLHILFDFIISTSKQINSEL